ncbi:MAG: cobalt transporter [Gracilibacter sp. BRH_c7a]|nr:MAG: cobalt transporter [Gracilibacter sp. BRH_c7a]
MENIMKRLNKISVENIKLEIMRTTFGNRDTFLSQLDPRVLMFWYLIFAIFPWFIYDKIVLVALLAFVTFIAAISKVSKVIIFLLCFGIASEIICYGIVAYFLGGGLEAFLALIGLTMKLATISLASIAIFGNIDPERLSDALLSWGVPGQITFAVSFGYRMVPVLIEEYNNIINSFRLRGKSPEHKGFLYWRQLLHMLKIAIYAFYPLIFNTAKRTRTTVEALEVRGFSYALQNKEVKKLKLAYLKIRLKDIAFLAGSVSYVIFLMIIVK